MTISLITVTLNSSATIRDTLDSVLRQSFSEYELIVVDGRSSDGTQQIIKEYEPLFGGKLRWISEPDNGFYDGLNKGIHMASGDVVGVINSDDLYHNTGILSRVYSAFSDNPEVQIVYGDVHFVKQDNLSKTVRYCSGKHFRLWKLRWGWCPPHPSFFTYRVNFEKHGYYHTDYEIAGDFELMTRFLYTHRLPALYIPDDFVTMRTGGKTAPSLRTMRKITHEELRACKENHLYTNKLMLMTRYFGKVMELRW